MKFERLASKCDDAIMTVLIKNVGLIVFAERTEDPRKLVPSFESFLEKKKTKNEKILILARNYSYSVEDGYRVFVGVIVLKYYVCINSFAYFLTS